MRKSIKESLIIIISFVIGFFLCFIINNAEQDDKLISPNIHFINGNSYTNYFTVHNIREAWKYSKGNNIKVGIFDHGFGINEYQELYSGWKDFRGDTSNYGFNETISHGFWMASTLREIAPEVEIYALGITFDSEKEVLDSMTKGIEWAIENDIDILTYSSKQFSESGRKRLDKILNKAYKKGIITIFLHYPNPNNLVSSEIDPRIIELNNHNNADIGIYKYDYSNIRGKIYSSKNRNLLIDQREFLSISSTAPVAAGIISLLLAKNPKLSREELKTILLKTSYTYDDGVESLENALDAKAAIEFCIDY